MRILYMTTLIGLLGYIECSLYYLIRDGYTIRNDVKKAYKVMYHARTWNDARLVCLDEGGKLAVPKTEKEFHTIQEFVRKLNYSDVTGSFNPEIVWLGINNLANFKVWVNVDGKNIIRFPFHKWVGENGKTFSNSPLEPHCATMDPISYGLRDSWCHCTKPYICEKTLS